MRGHIYRFGLMAFILCGPLGLFAQEVRTWQDASGLFSVEATLQAVDGDSIQLQRTDGTVITLPLARLSEADQRLIAGLMAGNPFEPIDNPFENVVDATADGAVESPLANDNNVIAVNSRVVDIS
jgi:hypothetical protein